MTDINNLTICGRACKFKHQGYYITVFTTTITDFYILSVTKNNIIISEIIRIDYRLSDVNKAVYVGRLAEPLFEKIKVLEEM